MHIVLYFALLATMAVIGVRCDLNDLCETADDCTMTNSYCKKESPCKKGICLCNRNFKAKDLTTCIKDALIGDACASPEECRTGGSSAPTCSDGSCKCPSGYEPYTKAPYANQMCTRIAEKLDAACGSLADKYCGDAATCADDNKCKCRSGYKKDDDYNCKGYNFKEGCTADSACVTSRSECKSAVCDCKESGDQYHEQDGMSVCLPASAKLNLGFGETCETSDMANLKYCGTGLTCSRCPEDQSAANPTEYCLEGCSGLQASITLLLLLLVGYFTL